MQIMTAIMEKEKNNDVAMSATESIKSKFMVNHVASGLPRWLIEAAFVCYLLQAVSNWGPLLHWMETHASFALAAIQTFGALVMYFGLMRGMKPLYRPMTIAWWIVIVLNIAGFFTEMIPAVRYTIGLPVAVSLMLVYLPLGISIAICYRGRLRWVGVWMALYIFISNIFPVVSYLLVGAASGLSNLPLEIPTMAVIVLYGWSQRRVLL